MAISNSPMPPRGAPPVTRGGFLQNFIKESNSGKNPMLNPQFAEKSPLSNTRIHKGFLTGNVTKAEYMQALANQAGLPTIAEGVPVFGDFSPEGFKLYNQKMGYNQAAIPNSAKYGPTRQMGPYLPSELPPAQPYGAPMRALNAGPQTQLLEQASVLGGPNEAIPMGSGRAQLALNAGPQTPLWEKPVTGSGPFEMRNPSFDPASDLHYSKARLAKVGEPGFVPENIWNLPEGHPDRVAAGIAEAEKVAAKQTAAEMATLKMGDTPGTIANALDDTIGAAETKITGNPTTVGTAGRGAKALTSLNKMLPNFMGEGSWLAGGGGGAAITGGTLMSGAMIATTGLMAAGMLDSMNIGGENSFVDHALTGAVEGGTLAYAAMTTLGLAGSGPVGWVVGAGIGLGALANWAFSDKDSRDDKIRKTYDGTNTVINDILNNATYNVDPDTASAIRQSVMSSMDILKSQKNLEGMQQYTSNLAATIPAEMLRGRERAMTAANSRYMQQAFGPVLADSMQRSNQVADQSYMFGMQAAQKIGDPVQRYEAVARVNQSRTASTNLVAAYAAQISGPQAGNMSPQGQEVLTAAQQSMP